MKTTGNNSLTVAHLGWALANAIILEFQFKLAVSVSGCFRNDDTKVGNGNVLNLVGEYRTMDVTMNVMLLDVEPNILYCTVD